MLSKTKIYIDKDSLEIIAQDSTISDNYYKNIIEILRRHADLYLNVTEKDLNFIRDPKDLNDPGDIYTFIEGKSLPWPSSAIENFAALHDKEKMPDINANVVYILNNKEAVKNLRDKYGVMAIFIDDLNDDTFYYYCSPDIDMDSVPGGVTENGWQCILREELSLLPPSNSIVVSDSNLLTNKRINNKTGENHFCGLVNLKDLLNLLLPSQIDVPYYILIVCPNTSKFEEGKTKKIVSRWVDEVRALRSYSIVVEFMLTKKTVHSRDLYTNYYQIHLDKGFYVFEPWTKKVHKEGESHNDIKIFSYLYSPFKRGKSEVDSAIIDLKVIYSKYDAFLRNTGESMLIDSSKNQIKQSDLSKNRILF